MQEGCKYQVASSQISTDFLKLNEALNFELEVPNHRGKLVKDVTKLFFFQKNLERFFDHMFELFFCGVQFFTRFTVFNCPILVHSLQVFVNRCRGEGAEG